VGEHAFNLENSLRRDFDIEEFIQNKNYNSLTFINDIALVKLSQQILFNFYVRPACLHQNKSEVLIRKTFIAIGFGAVKYGDLTSDVLMKVNLTVVHPNQCKDLSINVTNQICLKGLHSPTGEQDQYGDTCGGELLIFHFKKFN
jgi:hypothetical protein